MASALPARLNRPSLRERAVFRFQFGNSSGNIFVNDKGSRRLTRCNSDIRQRIVTSEILFQFLGVVGGIINATDCQRMFGDVLAIRIATRANAVLDCMAGENFEP
jgi:hypothetical protein